MKELEDFELRFLAVEIKENEAFVSRIADEKKVAHETSTHVNRKSMIHYQ